VEVEGAPLENAVKALERAHDALRLNINDSILARMSADISLIKEKLHHNAPTRPRT